VKEGIGWLRWNCEREDETLEFEDTLDQRGREEAAESQTTVDQI